MDRNTLVLQQVEQAAQVAAVDQQMRAHLWVVLLLLDKVITAVATEHLLPLHIPQVAAVELVQ
jgi:hypothetical protein